MTGIVPGVGVGVGVFTLIGDVPCFVAPNDFVSGDAGGFGGVGAGDFGGALDCPIGFICPPGGIFGIVGEGGGTSFPC